MRKKEICDCGKRIDLARQSLELDNCEDCARQNPGNVLNQTQRNCPLCGTKALFLPLTSIYACTNPACRFYAPSPFGNAPVPTPPPDARVVTCLKCGMQFQLNKDHVCFIENL